MSQVVDLNGYSSQNDYDTGKCCEVLRPFPSIQELGRETSIRRDSVSNYIF